MTTDDERGRGLAWLCTAVSLGFVVGVALGVQNAANSLGQASGPLLGGALFVWQMNAPYLLTGALLVAVVLVIGWKATDRQGEARLA